MSARRAIASVLSSGSGRQGVADWQDTGRARYLVARDHRPVPTLTSLSGPHRARLRSTLLVSLQVLDSAAART